MQIRDKGKELTANGHELETANGRESFANSPQGHREDGQKRTADERGLTQIKSASATLHVKQSVLEVGSCLFLLRPNPWGNFEVPRLRSAKVPVLNQGRRIHLRKSAFICG
jgi:hypothetical protein